MLQAKENSKKNKAQQNEAGKALDLEIENRYKALSKRIDIEASEDLNKKVQLPHDGMMVRMDSCMYGHFMSLKDLLRGAEKIRFFMDQESGIRAACLSVFHREIWDRIVRRKLSLFERPIATSSSLGRKWFAYSPYNPALVNKLLLIHRVHYNFVAKRGQKETPAMRLGLAKAPVEPEDIIYARGLSFKWTKALSERSINKKEFLKGPRA